MGKSGLLDLEKHFAFYGAYHSNKINVLIHTLFVWPILFSTLIFLHFTPSVCDFSDKVSFLPCGLFGHALVFNLGFLFTLIYASFYYCLDKKAGSLAALLCFACWVGASLLSNRLGFSLAWKVIFFFLIYCLFAWGGNCGKMEEIGLLGFFLFFFFNWLLIGLVEETIVNLDR